MPKGRGRSTAGPGRGRFVLAKQKNKANPAKKNASPKKVPAKGREATSPAKVAPRLTFDATKVAQEVLRLSEAGQHDKILRVLGDDVGPASGAVGARKAFLRISMLIHPDKLPNFPGATKAFQELVMAFDRTQKPDRSSAPRVVPQHAALVRSNDGCFRTEILCPRCQAPWGKKTDGNPDYFYNFMMEGLKCFSCSTCLLKFGCLTATHICPFCQNTFEYYPDQYHQKVTCGNPCCNKRFGFTLFHASERAMKNAREQVLAEFEAEARKREQADERSKRLARRLSAFGGEVDAESCFVYGLRDTCPRCGMEFSEADDGEQLQHLRTCNDVTAHKEHRKREAQREAAKESSSKKSLAQHKAGAVAVFNFCGGGAGQLSLLDLDQLRRLCNKEKLSASGSRDSMIERLSDHFAESRGEVAAISDIPSNLHSLSDSKLSALCAAHRLNGLSCREERLDALEELATGERVPQNAPKAIKGTAKALAIKDKSRKDKIARPKPKVGKIHKN